MHLICNLLSLRLGASNQEYLHFCTGCRSDIVVLHLSALLYIAQYSL